MRIDLTQSLPATKPPIEEEKDHTDKAKEEAGNEKIDLTKSPATVTRAKKETQEKKYMGAAWKHNIMNIKHKMAHQAHQHTIETALQVGV